MAFSSSALTLCTVVFPPDPGLATRRGPDKAAAPAGAVIADNPKTSARCQVVPRDAAGRPKD